VIDDMQEEIPMGAILAFEPRTETPSQDLVAETHHRVANSLTLLVSMVRMQSRSVKQRVEPYSHAEVRQLLDGVAARISTIGQLHRLLAQTQSEGTINLKPHLEDVTHALVDALSSPEQSVRVMHTGCDALVLTRQVQPIVLMLCEAFVNAMKYAHPSGVPLIMLVDCNATADGRLVLTISDDGVGLPEGFDPINGGGMGFKVMRSLAAEIGAQLDIRSTHLGLSIRLSLQAGAMCGTKLA
jgi:two-component sensor histidine kinase